jgi:NIMA-interacting peptidyl-prolyl cis-trans isomerase 1
MGGIHPIFDHWQERISRSKNLPYYYNKVTGESVWEKPSGFQSSAQVRASHLLVKHKDSRRASSWRQVPLDSG